MLEAEVLDTAPSDIIIGMKRLENTIAMAMNAENQLLQENQQRKRSWSHAKKHTRHLSSSVTASGDNPFALPAASYVTESNGSPRIIAPKHPAHGGGGDSDASYFSDGGSDAPSSPHRSSNNTSSKKALKKLEKEQKAQLTMKDMLEDKLRSIKEQNRDTQKRLESIAATVEGLQSFVTRYLDRVANSTDMMERMLRRRQKQQHQDAAGNDGSGSSDYAHLYLADSYGGDTGSLGGGDNDNNSSDTARHGCCVIC